MTYLDWAASAPLEADALAAASNTAARYPANPSSPHAAGREAAAELERLRACLAGLLGVEAGEVVFTSGATESDALALLSAVARPRAAAADERTARRPVVVVSAVEHAAVWEQAQALGAVGVGVRVARCLPGGRVDPAEVAGLVDADTALVSVMAVNNETGAVQPVAEIAAAVHERARAMGRRVPVHTDAAQAFGRLPFAPAALGVEAASLSSHKIGGPRGVGALVLRGGRFAPLLVGGGQEQGRRPGTENLAGIAGFVAAAEKRLSSLATDVVRAGALAERLVRGVLAIPGARMFPADRPPEADGRFSPWIVSFGFPPLPGEVVVRVASGRGVCVATGSACSSQKRIRTRVMEAMGLSREVALSSVRVSTGPSTSAEEIDGLLEILAAEVPTHLAIARGAR